jgi:hypothetical protein
LRTHHLFLLVLEVARAVDHRPNGRVLVELAKELPCHLVVSNLSELECERTLPVLSARETFECLTDRVENGVLRFTSRLAICHGNHQHWLTKLIGLGLRHDDLIEDLSLQ